VHQGVRQHRKDQTDKQGDRAEGCGLMLRALRQNGLGHELSLMGWGGDAGGDEGG
jgi:hypothetical protein